MIKRLPLQLFCSATLMLSSCNNTNSPQSGDAMQSKDSLKIKDSLKPAAGPKEAGNSEGGTNMMYTETLGGLKLELEAAKVLDILGQPNNKTKPELWAADNLYHQTWNYTGQGIKLDLIGKPDSVQTLNMITVMAPCSLKTKRGISIGSNWQQVADAYKEAIDTASLQTETIVAGTVYGGVLFGMENKKVKSIIIGSVAD